MQVLWPYLLELLVIDEYSNSVGVNEYAGAVAVSVGVVGD